MGWLKSLKELVFGKNGYDAVEHDAEVTRIKRRAQDCMDKTEANLGRMQTAFGKLADTDEVEPGDHPSVAGGQV